MDFLGIPRDSTGFPMDSQEFPMDFLGILMDFLGIQVDFLGIPRNLDWMDWKRYCGFVSKLVLKHAQNQLHKWPPNGLNPPKLFDCFNTRIIGSNFHSEAKNKFEENYEGGEVRRENFEGVSPGAQGAQIVASPGPPYNNSAIPKNVKKQLIVGGKDGCTPLIDRHLGLGRDP